MKSKMEKRENELKLETSPINYFDQVHIRENPDSRSTLPEKPICIQFHCKTLHIESRPANNDDKSQESIFECSSLKARETHCFANFQNTFRSTETFPGGWRCTVSKGIQCISPPKDLENSRSN